MSAPLVRFIARARHQHDGMRCGGAVSALLPHRPWLVPAEGFTMPERWSYSERAQGWVWRGECPECGKTCGLLGVEVRGKVTQQPCGSLCLNAKGHTCECGCGGKNHGAGYQASGRLFS